MSDHREELMSFFSDRLRVMLRDMGYSAQEVDAVLALRPTHLADLPKRLAAVRAFMGLPEAASLTAANKRIGNILKKAGDEEIGDVSEADLAEDAEKALYAELVRVEPEATADFEAGRYEEMLRRLAVLKAPVDAFFESVMVNAEDPKLRRNRHALLKRLYGAMNRVAELARAQ